MQVGVHHPGMARGPRPDRRQVHVGWIDLAVLDQLSAERGVRASVLACVAEPGLTSIGKAHDGGPIYMSDESIDGVTEPDELEALPFEKTVRLDRTPGGIRT